MQGIVVGNIADLYKVEVNGIVYDAISRGRNKNDKNSLVVGDKVEFNIENNLGIIENILQRQVYLKRPKIANVTQIIHILSTKDPKPDLLLLDKSLVYVEFLGIKSIIVINKVDLGNEYKEIEELYSKIGYKVIITSAREIINIEEIKECLKNNITVFSGNSGVGKSSIINLIFDEKLTLEGEISGKNKKGKNTTTDVRLFKLNNNSYVADAPGFSTFEISEIEAKDLYKYFIEFNEEIINCEYPDCSHIKEEKCGIKKAVLESRISRERYERYCKIYNEIKEREIRKW